MSIATEAEFPNPKTTILSAERIGAREDADSVANTVFNYYYKINSVIRKKLGIGPTETNLDIYLRKLMSEIDGAS